MDANRILFLAAENGALPNGKVGGVGDVIRDLPRALSERGLDTAVLVPAYGVFADLPGAQHVATVRVPFDGATEPVGLFEIETGSPVTQYVVDHPRFAPLGPGLIYCDDAADAPFATDATKFAFLCAVAATLLEEGSLPSPNLVHLHDWPAAFFLVLQEFDSRFARLQKLPVVFTIHNVALQG
ncbi:MAG TPA: glycogen/starch synthase, partial [Gammaproteobacteria bacterium]